MSISQKHIDALDKCLDRIITQEKKNKKLKEIALEILKEWTNDIDPIKKNVNAEYFLQIKDKIESL